MELEKRGLPTVTFVSEVFIDLAVYESEAKGFKGIPIAEVPFPMGSVSEKEAYIRAEAVFASIISGLTIDPIVDDQLQAEDEGDHLLFISEDFDSVNDYFLQQGWTDGLPIVPPTEERVRKMLALSMLDPNEVLGFMGPRWRKVTVEKVAVNAVMAGCAPEYFPLLLAAVEAMLEPAFNLYGVQATTNPAGPMLIINGPVVKKLDINAGIGLFGPGWRANSTIGRAVRLMLYNLGGGRPGIGDMSTLGNPVKYSACYGELEEKSPWEPLHVELGFAVEESTVTVVSGTAPLNVIYLGDSGEILLDYLAKAMTTKGSNFWLFDMQPVVVISPVHAQILERDGFDKQSIKQDLYKRAQVPVSNYDRTTRKTVLELKPKYLVKENGEEFLKIAQRPEDIMIFVAGGDGEHSAVIGTFHTSRAITRKIDTSIF
ncbi:UGSC family (seleno)protein [Neobacillus sp. NRS-1170]